jgi:hypothetical protein
MIFSQSRKGVAAMCGCNKNKNGQPAVFVVQTGSGQTKEVRSEQEARALVRINGGSYSKK